MVCATIDCRSACPPHPTPYSPGSLVSTFALVMWVLPTWVRMTLMSVILSRGNPRRVATCAASRGSGNIFSVARARTGACQQPERLTPVH